MILRPVTAYDAVAIYCWRAHPETQRFTPDLGRVTINEHLEWFVKRLQRSLWYMAECGDACAVGVIRVDQRVAAAREGLWVSLLVDPTKRGCGYGTQILQKYYHEQPLLAQIHRLNAPSLRAFEKAGFHLAPFAASRDGAWLYYDRERNVV